MRERRLLAGAVGLSALGDFLGFIPLALHVQERTGSGIAVAGLFMALWAPSVVLGGAAGLLADRVESRRLLRDVSLAQAAVALVLAFAFGDLAATLALTALLGVGVAVAQPAEFALVPALGGDVAAANGRIEAARYLGFTVGPVLGGLLAAAGGTRIALLVNAASFVAVAGAAQALRARREPSGAARAGDRARDGIAFLVGDAVLAPVIVAAFVSLLFMTASATAEVFFAKDVLHAGDAGYGALMTLWTVGMVIGSTLVAARVPAARYAVVALGAMAVQGAGLALPTVWLVLPFALAAYLVGGVGHGTKNVVVRTLIHTRVPDELRGRAWAAYSAGRNAAELVALVGGGLLVAAIGARWTLLLAGALPVVAAAAALVRRRGAAPLPPRSALEPLTR
jgi:MFS family permease